MALTVPWGPKRRPAVVLRVMPEQDVEYIVVAPGTTEPPEPHAKGPHLSVKRGDNGFKQLKLTDTTWFKADTFPTRRFRTDDDGIIVVGTCPSALLIRLLQLYGFK